MNKNIELIDFFPKYPMIEEGSKFDPYSSNFNKVIFEKKEFYDEKLDKYETKPSKPGTLMKHQKLIAKYLSSHTIYDSLLLFHEMGTGKSCAAVGVVEKIKAEDSSIDGAIFIASGDTLIDNFKKEIVYNCTDGRYIPEDANILTAETRDRRITKNLSTFYEFKTFQTFGKELNKKSDYAIIQDYSNKIIIIDEVHKLRETLIKIGSKKKPKNLNTYKIFHKFLHLIKNKKILLLSGTPMKDQPEEIAAILNLILPLSDQLPTGDKFIKEYMYKKDKNKKIYLVKTDKKDKLATFFKGRVSYLKAFESNISKEFIENKKYKPKGLDTIKVYVDIMKKDSIQNLGYLELFNKENSKKGDFFIGSRQASLFVYPNGSISEKDYLIRNERKDVVTKKKVFTGYSLSKNLKKELDGSDNKERFEKLLPLSSKYVATIKELLKNPKQLCFIYSEFVHNTGLILFSKILELFGFSRATGAEKGKGRRYALLTTETTTSIQIGKLIKRFNQKDNMNGDFIQVILGSGVIKEGISFFNVQQIHILTPWWDYADTDQAISRAIRAFSHQDLEEAGEKVELKIYQHISVPTVKGKPSLKDSIEFKMYKISEEKDMSIKSIERVLKESAVDCALNYIRNKSENDKDFSRNCEYLECDYKCKGVSDKLLKKNLGLSKLDISTYQLYYANILKIIERIKKLFLTTFSRNLYEITSHLSEFTFFDIITALNYIINNSVIILNKYGIDSYLREENNLYYLVGNLSITPTFLSKYYNENPTILDIEKLSKLITSLYYKNVPNIFDKMIENKDSKEREELIRKIPLKLQEFILEIFISEKEEGIETNKNIRNWILTYFQNFIKKIDGVYISSLLWEEMDILRCKKITWQDCDDKFIEKFKKIKQGKLKAILENDYGYYGIYKKNKGEFLIRDITSLKVVKSEDEREHTRGRVCKSWDIPLLVKILLKLEVPFDENYLENESKKKLLASAKTTKVYKKGFILNSELSKFTIEQLRRLLYYSNVVKKRDEMCNILETWFRENNLLIEE